MYMDFLYFFFWNAHVHFVKNGYTALSTMGTFVIPQMDVARSDCITCALKFLFSAYSHLIYQYNPILLLLADFRILILFIAIYIFFTAPFKGKDADLFIFL